MMRILILSLITLFSFSISQAQTEPWQGKFEPIDNMIKAPTYYRSASGAPSEAYW